MARAASQVYERGSGNARYVGREDPDEKLQQVGLRYRAGLTLLLAEQSIPLALAIADYAYVLQTGRVALEGTAADLEDNDQVRDIYLGFGAGVATQGGHV